MSFKDKVLAENQVALPKDEPEVPLPLRNPMSSTFLQRILMHYQVMPDGHPYNMSEVKLTPDDLKNLERMCMMPEEEKIEDIVQRDARWDRGIE